MIKTVRYAAELAIGDTVRTPSGREAVVRGLVEGRIDLEYTDGDQVLLQANMLTLMQRVGPQPLPAGFFAGERR